MPTAQPRLNPVLLNESNPTRLSNASAIFRPDPWAGAHTQSGCRFASRALIAHAKQHPFAENQSNNKPGPVRTVRDAPVPEAIDQISGAKAVAWPWRNSGQCRESTPGGLCIPPAPVSRCSVRLTEKGKEAARQRTTHKRARPLAAWWLRWVAKKV